MLAECATLLSRQSHTRTIIGLVALFFFSCSHRRSDESNVFCYNENAGISTLDPAFSRELETMWVSNQIFDGLLELNNDLQIVPCIAKSWEVTPDGLIYRFILRDSVFFHPSPLFGIDSTRTVTASDFVWSFNRIADPATASPGQWIFSYVDHSGNSGFIAENDTTLIIRLREPFQPFPGLLCTQYANVVPHEVVTHYGADFRSNPIGTGPFKFAFWHEQIALVLHRSDTYWKSDSLGFRLPYLDAVKIEFVKDVSVEFQGLLQGKYDFMSGIHPAYKDELLTPAGELAETYFTMLRFQRAPFVKTDYIGFVLDPKCSGGTVDALHDRLVRKALALAINRREMIRYLRNNTVVTAQGFVPPVLWTDAEYFTPSGYGYHPDSSAILLRQAGFPGGNGIPVITLATTSDYTDLMEFVQHEWQKIGVRAEVKVMQPGAFREATAKGQVHAFRKSWLADYADPENFLAVFTTANFSPAGPNYTHYSNDRFDKLYQRSVRETNDSLRNRMQQDLSRMVARDYPVIPLFHDQVSHFIRKNISGFATNGVNMIDLSTVQKHAVN